MTEEIENKNLLEYVISGCAHTRITLKDAASDPIASRISNIVKKAEARLDNHNITGLYNAFTEVSNGRNMYEGKHFTAPLHADSGGLQIVTRGLTADTETKAKVYEAQAKYSGVAMCFDEIPATAEKNYNLRLFEPTLVKEKATITAQNVAEQAAAFEKLKTDSKIFLIIQGNCLDTYYQWADVCVKNIPKDLHHFVGGISLAGTTSGMGEKEDIERMYAFSTLPIPDEWKSRLHMLGIGSPYRMLPVIGLLHSGVIPRDTLISYDSTTHSSGITHRRLTDVDATMFDYGHDNFALRRVYDFCKEYYDIEADYPTYCDIANFNRDFFMEKYGVENLATFHEAQIATCLVSVVHCAKNIEIAAKSKKGFDKISNQGGKFNMKPLTEVKNPADYEHYMNHIGRHLSTKKVRTRDDVSDLTSFFG